MRWRLIAIPRSPPVSLPAYSTSPLASVSVSSCFWRVDSFSKTAWYFRLTHFLRAPQQILLIGSQEAENLVVQAQTLCSAVHKLLSISKELRHSVGIETCDCFHWQTEVLYWSAGDGSGFLRPGIKCESKPYVLGVYQAERIVAKKIRQGKLTFMVKWEGYCYIYKIHGNPNLTYHLSW